MIDANGADWIKQPPVSYPAPPIPQNYFPHSRDIRPGLTKGGGTDRIGPAAAIFSLCFGLFGHLQSVVDLDAKVPDCIFQFAMAQ